MKIIRRASLQPADDAQAQPTRQLCDLRNFPADLPLDQVELADRATLQGAPGQAWSASA